MQFGQSYHNDYKFAPGGGVGEGTRVCPLTIRVCTPLENVMVSYIMARLPAITIKGWLVFEANICVEFINQFLSSNIRGGFALRYLF